MALRSTGGRADAVEGENLTLDVSAVPVINTAIYAVGELLGSKLSLASAVRVAAGGGIIQSVTILNKAKQNAPLSVVFFRADPSATTFTNHTALTVNAADQSKIIGQVAVVAADYLSLANISIGSPTPKGIGFALPAGTTLYAALISQGTPTYASTSDLTLEVAVLAD